MNSLDIKRQFSNPYLDVDHNDLYGLIIEDAIVSERCIVFDKNIKTCIVDGEEYMFIPIEGGPTRIEDLLYSPRIFVTWTSGNRNSQMDLIQEELDCFVSCNPSAKDEWILGSSFTSQNPLFLFYAYFNKFFVVFRSPGVGKRILFHSQVVLLSNEKRLKISEFDQFDFGGIHYDRGYVSTSK